MCIIFLIAKRYAVKSLKLFAILFYLLSHIYIVRLISFENTATEIKKNWDQKIEIKIYFQKFLGWIESIVVKWFLLNCVFKFG